jgi:hypothetical protein
MESKWSNFISNVWLMSFVIPDHRSREWPLLQIRHKIVATEQYAGETE